MNRIVGVSAFFAITLALAAGALFAQGQRGMLERKAWFVDGNNKISEMLYWRIYLGEYEVKLKRNVDGEGQLNVTANMNFDFFSSGYIEGNGFGSKVGKVNSLPGMRIRTDGGDGVEIKIGDIDYIYDYGTKVVTKDGRRGDFLIGAEGGSLLEIKRFQLSEYKMVKGSYGEMELKEASDRMPIVALAFSKEAAAKAAKEPVSNY